MLFEDPILDQTLDPTVDPTLEPTLDPTLDLILDLTLDPTLDPRAPPEPPRAGPALHSLPVPPELSLDVLLTFSHPSQLKHIVLRAFLVGNLPKKLSKLGVLDESGTNNKKTLHRSVTRVTFAVKKQRICTIWNSSADPPDPVKAM